MNKIRMAGLMFFILLIISCSKTEYVLNLSCSIKGSIVTTDEFGELLNDKENVKIELDGSNPLLFAITDTSGAYVIENVPTGTYNFIISKEGYLEQQYQGVQILGGEDFNADFYLMKESETQPENLSITFNDSKQFVISCNVFHTIDNITQWKYPTVTVFFDTTANVSFENHVIYFICGDTIASGGILETTYDIKYLSYDFDSGNKIFARAYGGNRYRNGYFDIETGKYILTGYVNPSNVFSTTMP